MACKTVQMQQYTFTNDSTGKRSQKNKTRQKSTDVSTCQRLAFIRAQNTTQQYDHRFSRAQRSKTISATQRDTDY